MRICKHHSVVVAILLLGCFAGALPRTTVATAPSSDEAVYASLLAALFPLRQGETLLLIDSTLVFRQPDLSYRPKPGAAVRAGGADLADSARDAWWRRLDSIPPSLLRTLAETSSRVRNSSELSLPRPTRQLSTADRREMFREGPGEGWIEFARRYPTARRYSAFSPVIYSADGHHALVYYEFHCGGLCGGGQLVLLELRADARWHVTVNLQTWVS